MRLVGHGRLSLDRQVRWNWPQIEVEVDVFQTEDNELKFFYNPEQKTYNFLTIELQSSVEEKAISKREIVCSCERKFKTKAGLLSHLRANKTHINYTIGPSIAERYSRLAKAALRGSTKKAIKGGS